MAILRAMSVHKQYAMDECKHLNTTKVPSGSNVRPVTVNGRPCVEKAWLFTKLCKDCPAILETKEEWTNQIDCS